MGTNCDPNISMPQRCEDRFDSIERKLDRVVSDVGSLVSARQNFLDRLWQLAKGVVLLVVGYVIARWSKGS